nr:MAG TPA: hypothetical protein [Bacteriophage sp.]
MRLRSKCCRNNNMRNKGFANSYINCINCF